MVGIVRWNRKLIQEVFGAVASESIMDRSKWTGWRHWFRQSRGTATKIALDINEYQHRNLS